MRRRDLILPTIGSLVGAVVAGCRRPNLPPPPTPVVLQGTGYLFAASVVDPFNRSHAHIRVATASSLDISGEAMYLFEDSVAAFGGDFWPLETALKTLNLTIPQTPQSAWNAFTQEGHILAVPFTQSVWGLLWREDAFRAANLPAPTDTWTVEDLDTACAALTKLVKAGTLPGLQAALGPLIVPPAAPGAPGSVINPGLWQSFALGYCGDPIVGPRVSLTGASTLTGLTTLLDLVRQYGSLQAPGLVNKPAPAPAFAVHFALLQNAALGMPALIDGFQFGTTWRWARMPRFPIRAPVLTRLLGQGLWKPKPADAQRLSDALVQFLSWTGGSDGRVAVDALGVIPVARANSLQSHFWSRWTQSSAVGDWSAFQDYAAGWPTAAVATQANDMVATILSAALQAPQTLSSRLAEAETRLNEQLNATTTGPA